MNSSACCASTSTACRRDEQPGTSSDRDECTPSSSDLSHETNGVDNTKSEEIRPVLRSWVFGRRLHQCVAAMQHRRANASSAHSRHIARPPPHRQRNPEREVILECRRELRRLWMYLDEIAVVRFSPVPPAG